MQSSFLFGVLWIAGMVVVAAASPPAPIRLQTKSVLVDGDQLRSMRRNASFIQSNYRYYFEIALLNFGTPPQWFLVNYETGHQSFFLNDPSLAQSDPLELYSLNASTTAQFEAENYEAKTGDSIATGKLYSDLYAMSNVTFRQNFGLITTMTNFPNTFLTGGLIGLAWDPSKDYAEPKPTDPFVVNLLYALHVKYGLQRVYELATFVDGGTLTIGSLNMFNCKQKPSYVPLRLVEWSGPTFLVLSFAVGDYQMRGTFTALADNGYAPILLPPGPYSHVLNIVAPEFDWDLGIFTVPCSAQLPGWRFSAMDGVVIYVTEFTFDLKLDGGRCAFGLGQTNPDQPDFVLGIPFFRAKCLAFDLDNNAIGFDDYVV